MNEARPTGSTDEFASKVTLIVGFIALTASALLAHAAPATGYELSLYTMTPTGVWGALGIAVLASLLVSLSNAGGRLQALGLGLGGLSLAVFAGLPIIRGYHFNGQADSLTHLGWAGDLVSGAMSPFELIYPGVHMVSAFVSGVTGLAMTRSMLFVVVVYVLVFAVFVSLSVRLVVPTNRAAAFGFVSALVLLPITTISTHMHVHSMSQAILFSALLLYLTLRYLVTPSEVSSTLVLGGLFAVVAGATVLYHPQLAAHFIGFLLFVCLVQFVYRKFAADSAIASYRPLYAPAVILLVAFLLWASNHGFFAGAGERAVVSAIEFVLGQRTDPAGEEIAAQGASVLAIGGSLAEVFFKLFFSDLLYSVLAGALILETITLRRGDDSHDATVARLFAVGMIALVVLFGIYFFSVTSEMYFRVFGLMMLFVTVLGAVALERATRSLSLRTSPAVARTVAIAVVGLVLVTSLAAAFPSPYTYSQSHHVTEMQMNGYETAFDHQDDEIRMVGIRDGPHRYIDAIRGGGRTDLRAGGVPGEAIDGGLEDEYPDDRYLAVTEIDRERELGAYQGIRYTEAQFDALTRQTAAHRVQSNGEFELFYVESE